MVAVMSARAVDHHGCGAHSDRVTHSGFAWARAALTIMIGGASVAVNAWQITVTGGMKPAVRAAASHEAVCVATDQPEFAYLQTVYTAAGWTIRRPGNGPCRFLVHYNEDYEEFPSLAGYVQHVFNTEKCVFDVYTDANGTIAIFRAAALRGRPAALKNCALRTLLALDGRSRALGLRDAELPPGATAEDALLAEIERPVLMPAPR